MKNNIASYIAANRIRQNAAQIGRKGRKHAYTPVAIQRDRQPGSGGGGDGDAGGDRMKITFEVPDTTSAAFLNFVFETEENLQMGSVSAGSVEIKRGETIKFKGQEAKPGRGKGR